jgi:hypothetical protein
MPAPLKRSEWNKFFGNILFSLGLFGIKAFLRGAYREAVPLLHIGPEERRAGLSPDFQRLRFYLFIS